MKRSTTIKVLTVIVLLVSLTMLVACEKHVCSFDSWTTIVNATHTETGLKQAICSCGETKLETISKTEEHAYSAWALVKDRTCTEAGLEERVCICGAKDSRTIPAAHDALKEYIALEATCEEDGLKHFDCELCKKTISEEIIPATGHKAQAEWVVITDADCENAGISHLSCETCKIVLEEKAIPATGHSYAKENDGWVLIDDNNCATDDTKTRACTVCGKEESETVPAAHRWETVGVKQPATCTADGSERHICTLCGVDEDVTLPATGHSYEWATKTEATCTENGWKEEKCTACGDVYATERIDATGHNYVEVIDAEETCTVAGEKHKECAVCKELLAGSKEAIPVDDHDFGEWIVTKAATCTAKGEQVKYCCCCGAEEKEVLAIIDHVYSWVYVSEADMPTCTKDGKQSWVCAGCGANQGTNPVKATGHSYKEVVTAPTCTAEGYTTHTCAACGDEYVDSKTEKAGHKFDHWTVTQAATCKAEGTQVRYCVDCNASEKEAIPALAHTYNWTVTTPATCLTAGEEKNICDCGDFIATKVIDALGHDMGEMQIVKAATCTVNGEGEYLCQREGCKHKETAVIEAAHSWTTEQVLKAPTCTEEGKAIQHCTVCGAKNDIVLDKVEHNMAWIEKTPNVTKEGVTWVDSKATCENSGCAYYKCTVCDYYTGEFKLTEKLAHTPAEEWEIDAPTCTADGKAHLHCAECNAEIQTKRLPATGHVDIKWVDKEIIGISNYVCTCGKVFDKMSIGLVIEGNTLVSVGTCTTEAVYLPSNVTKIAAGAFDGCKTITAIYLPAGLTEIGEDAFRDCANLAEIYFDGSNAAWDSVKKGADWNKNAGACEVK